MIRVTIWNEYRHEVEKDHVREIYPEGMHKVIADFLACDDVIVKTATLDEPECGLTQEVIDNTDVLLWWGHAYHNLVPDEIAIRVRDAVHAGMGFIPLHSGHHSKPFKLLMGTPGNLSWRCDGDKELVWVVDPSHPIAQGIDRYFVLEHEEMYGEPFMIPEPEKLVFIGSYEGGEVFRSGCCWQRGYGKIFYFQPGHERYPTYYNPAVQTVIKNAVRWAHSGYRGVVECPHVKKIDEE